MNTTQERQSTFSTQARKALAPNQEISQNGLIYRKCTDGTGTWRYDFVDGGQRNKGTIGRESKGVTLSEARRVLSEIRTKAISQRLSGMTGRSTQAPRSFTEVAEEYLAWSRTHHQDCRHNRSRMDNHLLPRFGNHQLGEISLATVEGFRSELYGEGLKRNTVQRIISLLSSVYEFARKADPGLHNPTQGLSRVKSQPPEITVFSKEETDAMLSRGVERGKTPTRGKRKGIKIVNQGLTLEAKALVGLGLYAGLRASETLGLMWEHVDFERRVIRVTQTALEGKIRPETKNYKARTVPISNSLQPILEALRESHSEHNREEGLVVSPDGINPYHQIQRIFNRIKDQAGIERPVGYHALRHTFATRAVEKGADLPVLQKLLGHSDIKVTMGYIHTSDAHIAATAEKLD